MGWLALLFIVVPAAELALLLELGSALGTLPTFALIVVTGVVGAALAKQQGLGVMRQLTAGGWPGTAIADGALILVAGALLVTPGVLTDAVGFSLLIPPVRAVIRGYLRRRFERAVAEGTIQTVGFDVEVDTNVSPRSRAPRVSAPPGAGPVIDVSPETRE